MTSGAVQRLDTSEGISSSFWGERDAHAHPSHHRGHCRDSSCMAQANTAAGFSCQRSFKDLTPLSVQFLREEWK